MIATVENMRRCEAAGCHAYALDELTGESFSASSGDYFWLPADEPLLSEVTGEPLTLVRRVPGYFAPILDRDEVLA